MLDLVTIFFLVLLIAETFYLITPPMSFFGYRDQDTKHMTFFLQFWAVLSINILCFVLILFVVENTIVSVLIMLLTAGLLAWIPYNKHLFEWIEKPKKIIKKKQKKQSSQQGTKNQKEDPTKEFLEFLRDIILILVAVFLIKTWIIAPFQIIGRSMEPSYKTKQFIFVDKWSYIKKVPQRWDVVVITPPIKTDKPFFIKRIIGMPGETLKIHRGYVFIKPVWEEKFIQLDESEYLEKNFWNTNAEGYLFDKEKIFKIPEGSYFVAGDNRPDSSDSRACFVGGGCRFNGGTYAVPRENIKGKLLLDMGYFEFFKEFNISPFHIEFGSFTWKQPIRGLNTHRSHVYPEFEG